MSGLDWLRRWLGESDALAAARAELDQARVHHKSTSMLLAHRTTERDQAIRERDTANALRAAAERAAAEAFEPAPVDGCNKRRLRDVDEAVAYAVLTEQDMCLPVGTFTTYQCATCPRQPASQDRYWHIANIDPAGRSNRNPAARRRERAARARAGRMSGRLVVQRLDPAVVQRLREATAS